MALAFFEKESKLALPMSQSVYKKVGIASLIMMASVFLSRLFGFLRLMIIAYVGGRSGEVDAYQVAFVIPEILNHIVASGFLSITFIPIFSQYLSKKQEAQGWQVFSIIFTCFGSRLLLFTVIAHVLAPDLVAWLAPMAFLLVGGVAVAAVLSRWQRQQTELVAEAVHDEVDLGTDQDRSRGTRPLAASDEDRRYLDIVERELDDLMGRKTDTEGE